MTIYYDLTCVTTMSDIVYTFQQERERVHKMKHPAKTVGARSSATLVSLSIIFPRSMNHPVNTVCWKACQEEDILQWKWVAC